MKLEIKRQAFHLLLGTFLATLIILLGSYYSLIVFGIALVFGIVLSSVMRRRKLPFFSWFIDGFEREKVWPGKGTINFFLGCFIALAFFGAFAVFVAILVFAFGDSFATIIGKPWGRHKMYEKKTWEGFGAGFAAGFLVALPYVPLPIAFAAALTASVIEVFSVIDDNVFIPPVVALLITLAVP